jgi:hypothetical protein
MSDTERCAVIGLRSGIVPNDPNTFFDGSQKKCQFFSWLTVSIRIYILFIRAYPANYYFFVISPFWLPRAFELQRRPVFQLLLRS